jgi:ribosome-associated toxin RatA of RatAB toxin-antitoxin module
MYQLINDIPAYPAFVPGCVAARVLAEQGDQVTASLWLRHAGFQKTITTQNHLVPNESIILQLIEGPVRHFSGGWYLRPLTPHSCQVTFDLQCKLNSSWLDYLVGSLFKKVVNDMTTAFIQRAAVIYGCHHDG